MIDLEANTVALEGHTFMVDCAGMYYQIRVMGDRWVWTTVTAVFTPNTTEV